MSSSPRGFSYYQVVGPLISEDEAIRVEAWIEEAVAQGAKGRVTRCTK